MDHTITGNIRVHEAFRSRFVKDARDVIVYLPPDYNSVRRRRYPVLYLHDGQNVFDAATAFNHNEWGVDEAAEELIRKGEIEPLIIAGVYNTPKRLDEYTHVRDGRGRGGSARRYAKAIIEDLKPFIDREYRTLRDAPNTGLGGSSLGGLATAYIGFSFPKVFGKLMIMSPSIWWANRDILKRAQKLRRKTDQKIWLDTGTCEGQKPEICVRDAEDLCATLLAKGWRMGHDLQFVEDEGAGHNEHAWGFRVRLALKFLFPKT